MEECSFGGRSKFKLVIFGLLTCSSAALVQEHSDLVSCIHQAERFPFLSSGLIDFVAVVFTADMKRNQN